MIAPTVALVGCVGGPPGQLPGAMLETERSFDVS